MSTLQTTVKIPEPTFSIDYQSSIFSIGSCFANNIGGRLEEHLFNTCVNPFGVLYNPISIANSLLLLLSKETFTENDLSFHNELWFSFAHYTLFSHTNKEECLKGINAQFAKAKQHIQSTNAVFITLGTSWYYTHNQTDAVVANCHKIPSQQFSRKFSDIGNSVAVLSKIIEKLLAINPAIQIVFTVSPIRHWKDGAIENQRSKAALLLTIRELQSQFSNIYYFPVYEIFMDELRDYRYYATDMLHPSELAQDIIWEKFSATFFTNETLSLIHSVGKIKQALKHKPQFPDTKAYSTFQASLMKGIKSLEEQYPFLNFNKVT